MSGLARDLHARYFHRIGLQAFPVGYGPGPGTLVLASPFCVRNPSFFGKISTTDIASTSSYADGLDLVAHKSDALLSYTERAWLTWSDLITETISTLGLDDGYIGGHNACHHRSAGAIYPVVFELAVHLACSPSGDWIRDVSLEWVQPATHAMSFADQLNVSSTIANRYLALYRTDWSGLLLRNDGLITAPSGQTFDAGVAWRRGASLPDLRAAASELMDA